MPPTYEPFSTRLTSVTMGIDAFERSCANGTGLLDNEGLVPIYLGDDLIQARTYASWSQAVEDLDELDARVDAIAPEYRREFARSMLRSLRAAVRLFSGDSLAFSFKVTELVGAPSGPVDSAEMTASHDALDGLLRRQDFTRGTLALRIARWEQERALPPQELESTFDQLQREGKARTAARIFDTGEFAMRLNSVRDVPYTARCGFDERSMDLNVDLRFTRAAIKHLVAHEVVPGHATQLLLTRDRVLAGKAHPETLLCTANTVLGCVQEGIADEGVALADWYEDDDDHIHVELRRLRSAAQTSAAWYYMEEGWQPHRVAEYLRDTAAGQDVWIAGRLKMAAHPFRGPFIASYWAGARAVRRVLERVPANEFPRFVEYLYANAHSPRSLEMFE